MKRFIKYTLLFVLAFGVLGTAYFLYNKRNVRFKAQEARLAQEIEQKMVLDELSDKADPEKTEDANAVETAGEQSALPEIPKKYLIAMPFYSQAPDGNWDKIHEEMCEEASLLNAGLYLLDKKLSNEEYDRELLKLKDLGENVVGTWVSTTVAETKKISDAHFAGKIQSKIIDNPTVSQIETEVSRGNPVIVPLAGREIGNPNYTPPGPIYHMLVIKGYDEKYFVTNDVGTRKGNSYVFRKEIIMDKMHDWNEKDIHLGDKRVLVLTK